MVADMLPVLPLAWLALEDLRSRTIPDAGILLLLLCGLVRLGLGAMSFPDAVFGLLVVGVPVLLFAVLLGHGTAIGGGDVKLCAAIGFLLGPVAGCMTVYFAILLLALCGLVMRRRALPFAPFLLPAYCAIFIVRRVLNV